MNRQKEMKGFATEKSCLDSQLWHACAGGMVQMPALDSKVVYFPQGHAQNAQGSVDFGDLQVPAMVLCKVSGVKYMADVETDEVYAKVRLVPLSEIDFVHLDDSDRVGFDNVVESQVKTSLFAKTLTHSDANNGGGFSMPRYCAETIFPKLDYNADPPVQTILVKDVHCETWKFRHIYRGTPRRHLLTAGWSNFVNHKKLVAGDSIVFYRNDNGELHVAIRRARRGIGGGNESNLLGDVKGKVSVESVIKAVSLAAYGRPFEIVYYPRSNSSEFFVRASAVKNAMQVPWVSGMRFKMPFETEDSSRISWFMGTVSSVKVFDPIHWPNSPWQILQVSWDEPILLKKVKRVSPWSVELVSTIPTSQPSLYLPPTKKLRITQTQDIPYISETPINSPSCYASSQSDSISTGIQGARHFNKPCLELLRLHENNETQTSHIVLFGHIIFPEQQSDHSCSGYTNGTSSSEGSLVPLNGNSSSWGSPYKADEHSSEFSRTARTLTLFEEE